MTVNCRRYLSCLFTLLLMHSATAQQTRSNRPNIIFILSDDHAWQAISAYGSQLARTPHIDSIAGNGALFTQAIVIRPPG